MSLDNLLHRGLIVTICGVVLIFLGKGQVFKAAPNLPVDIIGWIAIAIGVFYIIMALAKKKS